MQDKTGQNVLVVSMMVVASRTQQRTTSSSRQAEIVIQPTRETDARSSLGTFVDVYSGGFHSY